MNTCSKLKSYEFLLQNNSWPANHKLYKYITRSTVQENRGRGRNNCMSFFQNQNNSSQLERKKKSPTSQQNEKPFKAKKTVTLHIPVDAARLFWNYSIILFLSQVSKKKCCSESLGASVMLWLFMLASMWQCGIGVSSQGVLWVQLVMSPREWAKTKQKKMKWQTSKQTNCFLKGGEKNHWRSFKYRQFNLDIWAQTPNGTVSSLTIALRNLMLAARTWRVKKTYVAKSYSYST